MSLRTKSPVSLLRLGAVVVVSCVPALGYQDEKADLDQAGKHELSEQRATIRERNRSTLYPGDPLVLVGVEQGDNDLRSRSPALKNGQVVPRQVDLEQLREQKLGLYREEARAPQPVSIPHRTAGEVRRTPRSTALQGTRKPWIEMRLAIVLASLLGTALVGIWCFRRYRRVSERMEDDLHVPGVPRLQSPGTPADSGVVRPPAER